MPGLTLLVIDDDPAHVQAVVEIAERAGFKTVKAHSGAEGIERLKNDAIDLVVTDLAMRDRSGLDIIAAAHALGAARPEVVVVTGYGSEAAAPAVRRAGAAAYLTKPLSVGVLRSVLDRLRSETERRRGLTSGGKDANRVGGMVGRSEAMRRVFDLVARVADSHATVLIQGESGTGKELVARALHDDSPRRAGRFVAVNCAALSAGLLESELFGHEKGAFTGAHTARIGRFEAADGGTLFLDEVSEMDSRLQAKLLRVLEEREIVRVGSNDPVQVDVRLVAATNRTLKDVVDEGGFRADLYYRLHVVSLTIPPLRDRIGDIPLLIEHFCRELAREHHREQPVVEQELVQHLAAMPWPGNVRELRNTLETLLITTVGPRIALCDLPVEPGTVTVERGAPLTMRPLAEVERDLITNTLRDVGGNRARAAEALGISARTLYRRIKELNL